MTDRLGAPGSYFFTCLLSKFLKKGMKLLNAISLETILFSKALHILKCFSFLLFYNFYL